MKRSLVVLVAVVATAVLALPAAAGQEETGPRLVLFPAAPATFAADEPFHVMHGWGFIPPGVEGTAPWLASAVGKLDFTLAVDGRVVEPSSLEVWRGEDEILWRMPVYSFPAGLPAGTHTFTGTWLGPCESMVRGGFYSGSCANPAEVVVAIAPLARTVEFTP